LATAAGLGGLAFISFGLPSESRPAAEISMQHFLSNILASGRVSKLLVVNSTTVRVVLNESSGLGEVAGLVDGGSGGAAMGDGRWSASGSGGAGGGSASLPTAPEHAEYVFTIGGVEQFEEKLDAAQAALGVPQRDYVPVQFVAQPSMLAELGRFLPTILIIGFFFVVSRGMSGAGGGGGGASNMFNVGKSKAVRATKVKSRFKDVAGLQEAKVEIMEFVDILQNPERYTKLGAKIPRGALLVGPPGCGKTLLAKATAGEAKAPFYSISGSDFIEMFVGVGPSRVRDLFAKARANAPCLIFIDEIDAVGRTRGKGGFGGGNDERENTLNQLLIEMDGFSSSAGVIVLAGTNRADILDPALLRPGRFDRQIAIDKPDIRGRTEIFGVHLAGLKLDGVAEMFAKKMAALTPGFSGAEVANVCNEAALIAARRKLTEVTSECFDAAVDRVIAGMEKKGLTIDPHERRVVAFHEAGHALTGWLLEHADPVMKVSIIPRGKAALGYSQSLPRDVALHTEEQLFDTMVMACGGRAAEEVVFNEVSSGAQNDLERVTRMAYSQVTDFGMSAAVGPLSFGGIDGENTLYKPFSERTARLIDGEAGRLVEDAYCRAIEILREKEKELHALAEALLAKEVISSEELVQILGPRPFSKSVEYDEFIAAAWTSAEAAPVEVERGAEGEAGEGEGGDGGMEENARRAGAAPEAGGG
jgi:AFG3 family protein